jgi:hypothetical protein
MDQSELLDEVGTLRSAGLTPKQIARTLGLRPSQVGALIRASAKQRAVAVEPALAGCWINRGWSSGLRLPPQTEWRDPGADDGELPALAIVVVARERRYGKVSACSFLVDAQCLGVKNVIGPRTLDRDGLARFLSTVRYMSAGELDVAPLDLARELVLGAVDYARGLGFSPHPDFEACRGYLGAWTGPSAIGFGWHGRPLFVEGPDDDALRIIGVLQRAVGPDGFDFVRMGG